MFTGIIETLGQVESIEQQGSNRMFWIRSAISPELRIDQSVSHDGVCLTVDQLDGQKHRLTAIAETLDKTALDRWIPGYRVNLERCLQLNGRLDGHLVQGHVDTTAICVDREEKGGSWVFRFEIPEAFAHLIVEKGSIALNGISLTLFNLTRTRFSVAVIPYTFQHTNIGAVQPGDRINIEFDLVGKYINRRQDLAGASDAW